MGRLMSKHRVSPDVLTPGKRRGIVAVAVVDVALRAWAIADLVRRPQSQVRGSKTGWAIALTVVNSVGVLPVTYLAWARHAG